MEVKINDLIILFNNKHQYKINFKPEMSYNCSEGNIKFEKILNYGQMIKTNRDKYFIVLHPNTVDKMLNVIRSTTIVYPKDLGMIVSELGIRSNSKILEIGTGSAALTFTIANIIGASGTLNTVDISVEKQDKGKLNFQKHSEFDNTKWHILDLAQEHLNLDEPADGIFVDIPEPWKLINSIRYLLKDGHTIGFLCPSFEQVKLTAQTLNEYGFTRIRCKEVIERKIFVRENSTRPGDMMNGHSAFYIFAEKINDQSVPDVLALNIRQTLE